MLVILALLLPILHTGAETVSSLFLTPTFDTSTNRLITQIEALLKEQGVHKKTENYKSSDYSLRLQSHLTHSYTLIQALLTCKGMPKLLDGILHPLSWQPAWTNTRKDQACDCAPANYGGMIPYFAAGHYPERWERENLKNRIRCIYSIYDNPSMYGMDTKTSACLKHPIPLNLRNQFNNDDANKYLVEP